VFGSSSIPTIILRGTFMACTARRKQSWIFGGTEPLLWRNEAMLSDQLKAKRSDVNKILKTAAEHFDNLAALWEAVHGKTNDRA
jgi:hypothetical protein